MTQEYQHRLGGYSFLICIRYQEHSTYQGTIQWLDGEKSRTFRSFLEMMLLMQEALADDCSPGSNFRSWKKQKEEAPAAGAQRQRGILA
ncbi:MAG: hypothetical protein GX349_07980 [Firmicutes bacterium]|nr:hypothetical protein [Bacillota bacterium]